MLTPKEKGKIIKKYKLHDNDTGSSEVQVALLTEEINRLTKHLRDHVKDNSSRRGLLKMVARRKHLLDFLSREDNTRYHKVIKALGIKK